ncbi:MAG: Gldg family protein [Polyangiales bacterium]
MSEDSKNEETPSSKKPVDGESEQSVTKMERRRPSEAPKDDDEAKAKDGTKLKDDAKAASSIAPVASGKARRNRAFVESWGAIAVLGGVLIAGNIALMKFSAGRIDTTKEERYTLSKKGTAHLLSTLTKELKITVYKPEGLATVDSFMRDLQDILDEYVRYGAGKVSYEIVVPDRLEGEQKAKAESEAQAAGLKLGMHGENTGGSASKATIGQGYFGMVLNYGAEHETLDQSDGFSEHVQMGLEFLISGKIRELRDKEDKIIHKIGFLQGHKEKGFQELNQIFTRNFPYYKFEAVDLTKGEKAVDESLDGLIVAQPEEEISAKELHRIDQFLMKGKAVAIFANTVHLKEADASMAATFAGMGIDKLMAGYGVDYKNELLIDAQQFWTPVFQLQAGIGAQLPPYPFIFMGNGGKEATFKDDFAPFFRLQQIAIPFPTEITVDKARAGGDAVTITNVAHSTKKIVTLTGTSIGLSPNPEKQGQGASQKREEREAVIAVDIEGAIKSAFPGGGEGVDGVPAVANGKARLFVVSTAQFFGNPFQDAGKSPFAGQIPGMDPSMGSDEELMRYAQLYQRGPRISSWLIAKATSDWISQETDLLSAGAKLTAPPEITFKSLPAPVPAADEKLDSDSFKKKRAQWLEQINSTKTQTMAFNTFGGGILIGLFGILRWWQRNSARASVKI